MLFKRFILKATYSSVFILSLLSTVGIVVLLESKTHIFSDFLNPVTITEVVTPFPVSVNSFTKVITADLAIEKYLSNTAEVASVSKSNWWNKVAAIFSKHNWYQNLASSVSRIIVIWPGERKEEVVKNVGDILNWNQADRLEFQRLINTSKPPLLEGKYFPGQYVTHRGVTPQEIQRMIYTDFETEIISHYTPEVSAQVPLKDALIIASLLEREASDFDNMREVSGVIWNRLFINIPLQLDATLQYVRGNNPSEPKWWPQVKPRDKFIESDYNTYQNKGLPPHPIANPSTEAILAALNPVVTDCLYYFHTRDGKYHCSESYTEHVDKLKAIYGRGS